MKIKSKMIRCFLPDNIYESDVIDCGTKQFGEEITPSMVSESLSLLVSYGLINREAGEKREKSKITINFNNISKFPNLTFEDIFEDELKNEEIKTKFELI